MFTYTVDVGFTTMRPVRPDQHTSRVHLLADTDHDATLLACQLVASRPGVEMVTSATITKLVL